LILQSNEEYNILDALHTLALILHDYDYDKVEYPSSLTDVILNPVYREILFNLDKYIDRILSRIPKSQKRRARKALQILQEMARDIDKIIENPPAWLKEYVINSFLYGLDPHILLEALADEYSRYVPVIGERGKKLVVLLRPSKEELEKIKVDPVRTATEIDVLLAKNAEKEYRARRQTITAILSGERLATVSLPRRLFYKEISVVHDATDMMIEIVLDELKKRGIYDYMKKRGILDNVEHEFSTLTFYSKKKVKCPAFDNGEAEERIHVRFRNEYYDQGDVVVSLIGKIHGVKTRINAPITEDTAMFYVIEEIPYVVDSVEKEAFAFAEILREYIETARRIGEKYGLKWSVKAGYDEFSEDSESFTVYYAPNPYLYFVKHYTGKVPVDIDIKAEYDTRKSPRKPVFYNVEIRFWPGKGIIEKEKILTGISGLYNNIETTISYYIILKLNYPGEYTIEEVVEDTFRILGRLLENHRRLAEIHREQRRKIKMTSEKYVAIYLYEWALGKIPDLEKRIHRQRGVMYSMVRRVLGRIDPPALNTVEDMWHDAYDVIKSLIRKGYIKITKDLQVLVNNKPIEKLLKGIVEPDNEALKQLRRKIVQTTLFILCQGTKYIECLEKHGLLSPKSIDFVLREYTLLITPEELAREYNGKPLWSTLPREIRDEYIKWMSPSEAYRVLSDSKLRPVFCEELDKIEEKILKARDFTTKTKYLYNYRKDLLGPIEGLAPHVEKDFFALRKGDMLVQVKDIDKNEYIVYREKEKVGFIIRADNIYDAILRMRDEYDKYLETYKKLEKKTHELTAHYIYLDILKEGEYKIPVLIDNRPENPVEKPIKPESVKEIILSI